VNLEKQIGFYPEFPKRFWQKTKKNVLGKKITGQVF
jgi:hypothetical protein